MLYKADILNIKTVADKMKCSRQYLDLPVSKITKRQSPLKTTPADNCTVMRFTKLFPLFFVLCDCNLKSMELHLYTSGLTFQMFKLHSEFTKCLYSERTWSNNTEWKVLLSKIFICNTKSIAPSVKLFLI